MASTPLEKVESNIILMSVFGKFLIYLFFKNISFKIKNWKNKHGKVDSCYR